jgi:hypothetical protein
MSDRLDELALRRRRLLLRSERLRADLRADQQVMLDALSGVDRAYSMARRAARPLLMVSAGALLFRLFRGRRGGRAGAGARGGARAGFAVRALFWVSAARRLLPYVPLVKALWRSRFSQRAAPENTSPPTP